MKKTLLLVVSLLLLLAGCRSHDAQYDLAACGSYGVPGMFCLDLKENSCEVLAKDPYGRVLFRYTAYSVITKKIETAVVICQKSSSSNVCFYEDLCYYLGEPTDVKTAALKERNDWEKPLNENAMATRSYSVTLDLCLNSNSTLDYSKLLSACACEFMIHEEDILQTVFLDKNQIGKYLYWIELKSSAEKYFIIIDESYAITQMKADGTEDDMTNLTAFKEQSKW